MTKTTELEKTWIGVERIEWGEEKVDQPGMYREQVGRFVSIRPAKEEQTYLGILLGEIALSISVNYDEIERAIQVKHAFYNPAIYVFDLKKIIYGIESWWGIIESPEDLKKITNQDIDNVWYVKALKELQGGGE